MTLIAPPPPLTVAAAPRPYRPAPGRHRRRPGAGRSSAVVRAAPVRAGGGVRRRSGRVWPVRWPRTLVRGGRFRCHGNPGPLPTAFLWWPTWSGRWSGPGWPHGAPIRTAPRCSSGRSWSPQRPMLAFRSAGWPGGSGAGSTATAVASTPTGPKSDVGGCPGGGPGGGRPGRLAGRSGRSWTAQGRNAHAVLRPAGWPYSMEVTMAKMVGWTSRPPYGGQRVSPAKSLYPSPIVGPYRRRPGPNRFTSMGSVPKRRRRR